MRRLLRAEAAPRASPRTRAQKTCAAQGQDEEISLSPFSITVGQVYDGPMDLLLDLIRKQNIDIYDIPMGRITAQFLEYCHVTSRTPTSTPRASSSTRLQPAHPHQEQDAAAARSSGGLMGDDGRSAARARRAAARARTLQSRGADARCRSSRSKRRPGRTRAYASSATTPAAEAGDRRRTPSTWCECFTDILARMRSPAGAERRRRIRDRGADDRLREAPAADGR